MKKKIIHIGLQKTGTTTLQTHIFPQLSKDHNILYNPLEYLKIQKQGLVYNQDDLIALKEVFSKNDVLISHEGLVDWNPRNWLTASNRALELFDKDATIIITIREPIEYMTSLYIQKIHHADHGGKIIRPHEFFISSKEYDSFKETLPEKNMLMFDHQLLNYEYLISLYKRKFSDVRIVPLSRINTLYPFVMLFDLNANEVNSYMEILKDAPRENQSYSKLAINLTFKKERILRFLNFKSTRSDDYQISTVFFTKMSDILSKPFSELPLRQKLLVFPLLAFKKILKPWRWWMQRVVDKFYPYEKFNLPKDVLDKFDKNLLSKNRKIIRDIETKIDALKISNAHNKRMNL